MVECWEGTNIEGQRNDAWVMCNLTGQRCHCEENMEECLEFAPKATPQE